MFLLRTLPMRKLIPLLIGAAFLSAAPAQAARPTPEERLAKLLEGRVAGEPVSCIDLHRVRSSRIIDGTAIVYEAAGGKLYVNRPASGARSLDRFDVLVTRNTMSRLCNVDVVELYDSSINMPTGLVFLGDFVPYTRAPRD